MREAEHAYTTHADQGAERQRLRALRAQIETTLGEMIDLLDMLDGDADLEGTTAVSLGDGYSLVLDADCEAEPDAEDDDPAEPSLGSSAVHGWESQEEWARGTRDDREGDEHDGSEPDQDGEPSLGATHGENQERAWQTTSGWSAASPDLEQEHDGREPDSDLEPDDSGIVDPAGLWEQQGQLLPYDEREKVCAAAREAREALRAIQRRKRGVLADGSSLTVVGFVDANGTFRRI